MGLAATYVALILLLLSIFAAMPPATAKLKTSNITAELKNYEIRCDYFNTHKLGQSIPGQDRVASFNSSIPATLLGVDNSTPYEGFTFGDSFKEDIDPNSNHVGLNINGVRGVENLNLHFGFSAPKENATQLNRVRQWNLTLTVEYNHDVNWLKIGLIVGLTTAVLLPASVALVYYSRKRWLSRRSDRQMSRKVESMPGMPRKYRYKDLQKATNNFDEMRKLGQASERPKTQEIVQMLSGSVPVPYVPPFRPPYMLPLVLIGEEDISQATTTDTTSFMTAHYGPGSAPVAINPEIQRPDSDSHINII
ncbi:hypothetical protein RHGRI_030326 [Rhododendron griersonianum]|uniref:Legume lectin domain-containing protein n=1 Tax=Rhododendron griersonianum TaxID=479676 RepID=A0AAV6IMG6_9ERIC|nr:hypothetical protein RHGRI_030326 [Rhododendron griersonianum]